MSISKLVPFRDETFCANKACPRARTCGTSILRLEYLAVGPCWMAGFQLNEDGTCDHERPFRSFVPGVVKPRLERIEEQLKDIIEIARKHPDEDGMWDKVQNKAEIALDQTNDLLAGFNKGDVDSQTK